MTSPTFNTLILDEVFPDPVKVFAPSCPRLGHLKGDCLYVLDANALLAPFELDIAPDIVPIYTSLHNTHRLYTTKRSVQEFARNRQKVLAKAYKAVHDSRSNLPPSNPPSFPFLRSLTEYKALTDAAGKVKAVRKSYVEALDTLERLLLDWTWDDPISQLYRKAFTAETIVDHGLSKDEIVEDFDKRILHSLPPGYKDKNKPDGGVGDILIWHSVIAAATKFQKNIVIVSNDAKADWVVSEDSTAIGLRPELEYEFRHKTNKFVAIASYSRFLEMNDAKDAAIEQARSLETVELPGLRMDIRRISPLIKKAARIITLFSSLPIDNLRSATMDRPTLETLATALHTRLRTSTHPSLLPTRLQLLFELRTAIDDVLQWELIRRRLKDEDEAAHATLKLLDCCKSFLAIYDSWREYYIDSPP